MQAAAATGLVAMWSIILILITPVVTSIVFAEVFFTSNTKALTKFFYYLIAIPLMFVLSAVWLRLPNGLDGYFYFTIFIVALEIYLWVRRIIASYK